MEGPGKERPRARRRHSGRDPTPCRGQQACARSSRTHRLFAPVCAVPVLSLVLFEASNLFLMPHHLMTQLDYHGKWHFLNGLAFFATCTLARVFGCVALGISYVRDAATLHERDWELVLCVSLSLVSFWAILLLSLYWYVHDVLGEVHKELAIKCEPPRAKLR